MTDLTKWFNEYVQICENFATIRDLTRIRIDLEFKKRSIVRIKYKFIKTSQRSLKKFIITLMLALYGRKFQLFNLWRKIFHPVVYPGV